MVAECIASLMMFPSADIEVACYGYDGIDAVKDALRAGLSCSTEVMPIKVMLASATFLLCHLMATGIRVTLSNRVQINLIAPPRYVMTTTTLERTEGLSVLNQAMAAIKEKIEEKRGVFNIQMEVRDINTETMFTVFNKYCTAQSLQNFFL